MTEQEIMDVATLDNEIEARLLESILEERGIVCDILTYHDTAYDGMYQVQKGWGVVRADKSVADEITSILEDLRSGDAHMDIPEQPDDEE